MDISQVKTVSTKQCDTDRITSKFGTIGSPIEEMCFGVCYKLYTEGFFFNRRYFILEMKNTEVDFGDLLGAEEWCSGLYELKAKKDWKCLFNYFKDKAITKNTDRYSVDMNGYSF